MYRAYARERDMRVNLGIRRRLAPLLGNDRRLIELMNSLLFSLPGTPILYYGDEIGMGDNVYLGDRNGVRTPMQWSADRNAGFSRANPQRLFLPTIIDPEYHYESVNVEAQQNNPRSLLWWMKRMIALRRRHHGVRPRVDRVPDPGQPEGPGVPAQLDPPDGDEPEQVLVVANLSRYAQACELDLSGFSRPPSRRDARTHALPTGRRAALRAHARARTSASGSPWSASRPRALSKTPGSPTGWTPEPRPQLPTVTVAGQWTALLRGPGRERLEAALPEVLRRQRWFGGKAREIRGSGGRRRHPGGAARTGPPCTSCSCTWSTSRASRRTTCCRCGSRRARRPAGCWPPPGAVLATVKGQGQRGESGVLVDALPTPTPPGRCSRPSGPAPSRGAGLLLQGAACPASGPRCDAGRAGAAPAARRAVQHLGAVRRPLPDEGAPPARAGGEPRRRDHRPPRRLEHVPRAARDPRRVPSGRRGAADAGDGAALRPERGRRLDPHPRRARPVRRTRRLERHAGGASPRRRRRAPAAAGDEGSPSRSTRWPGRSSRPSSCSGRRTAQLHAALAADSADPAFAPEPMTRLYQRSLYQSVRNSVRMGLRAAGRDHGVSSPRRTAPAIQRLVEREEEILERLQRC
jgi:maltose alpha-D-glucosyltransferase / alpha-amylase